LWDDLASLLMNHFRVICLDQRGHGDSDWARPPAYGCNDYVSDLEGFIAALRLEKPILMGHSMGALHATRYASTRPRKVAALIHMDIEPCPPDWNRDYLRGLYHRLPAFYDSVEAFAEVLKRSSPYAAQETIHRLACHALKPGEDGKFYAKCDKELFDHFDQYDLRADLRRILCPTLLVRGEESVVMRREKALEMQQAISGSRLVEIPRATHRLVTDNPSALGEAVLDFLTEHRLL